MNLAQITSIILILYAFLIIWIVYKNYTKTKDIKDFAVGSGFSPLVVGLSLAASMTSAATFIINPGFVAMFGWSAFLAMSVVLPIALFISLIVLSKSFRKYGNSINALTLAQWMGKRYHSKTLSMLMAVLSLLLLTFVVLICVGLTKVIAGALGANELYVLIVMILFVFGYMMFGGANSMVYTNTIQAILMFIVAIILLGSGMQYFSDGWSGFWSQIEQIDPNLVTNFNPKSPLFRDAFEVIFCNFVVGVAIVCQPHIITRSLMLKDDTQINKYLFYSIAVQLVFFLVLFAGFYARMFFPDLTLDGQTLKMDGILPTYVVQKFSPVFGVIVVMGLMSAGLSTLEGLIQSLSTTITNDILAPILRLPENASSLKNINRITIVILAILSIIFSYQQLINPNLSVALLAQNGVYAFFSAAFVPILFGIFLKKTPKQAAIGAAITAFVVHFTVYYGALTPYTSGTVRNPAVAATLAILSAVLIGGILYFLFPKTQNLHTSNE
ncbi:MAG: sodium:solute symporter [Saprospiraceae bacterium]